MSDRSQIETDPYGYAQSLANQADSGGQLAVEPTDASTVGANPQVQAAAQKAALTSSPPGTFSPQQAGALTITGDMSAYGFGLPTSDQQVLAELQNTTIFTGYGNSKLTATQAHELGMGENPAEYQSASQLLNKLTSMSRSEVTQLQQRLIAGQWLSSSYIPSGIVDSPTEAAYIHMLATVANYQQNGNYITPDQLLQMSAQGAAAGKTNISSTVDLTDPMTARGVVNAMFENTLGRAPNSEDIKGFVNALQGYEEAHPGTSETTETVGKGGNVTRDRTTERTGGMGSSLSLRGGDVAAAQEYIDQVHGGEEAQVGVDTLAQMFGQLVGVA